VSRPAVGITLPAFVRDPDDVFAVARAAEAAELDGVFVYDHLFRVAADGTRRPALEMTALLHAVIAETRRVAVGVLVARAALRPAAVTACTFATAARVSGGRVIAGIGAGDSESARENEEFGVGFGSFAERIADLGAAVRATRDAALAEAPAAFLETQEEVLADPIDAWDSRAAAGTGEGDALIVLALDGGRPVGVAGIARDIGQRRRHRATMWGVWVNPSHRGRGVGRRIVTEALDWAGERDVRAVYLEVVENEDPSWSLYGRLGFVRREVDPFGAHVDGRFVALEHLVLVLDQAA